MPLSRFTLRSRFSGPTPRKEQAFETTCGTERIDACRRLSCLYGSVENQPHIRSLKSFSQILVISEVFQGRTQDAQAVVPNLLLLSAAMTPEEFRKHGYAMIDWIADYVDDAGSRPGVPRRQTR